MHTDYSCYKERHDFLTGSLGDPQAYFRCKLQNAFFKWDSNREPFMFPLRQELTRSDGFPVVGKGLIIAFMYRLALMSIIFSVMKV